MLNGQGIFPLAIRLFEIGQVPRRRGYCCTAWSRLPDDEPPVFAGSDGFARLYGFSQQGLDTDPRVRQGLDRIFRKGLIHDRGSIDPLGLKRLALRIGYFDDALSGYGGGQAS